MASKIAPTEYHSIVKIVRKAVVIELMAVIVHVAVVNGLSGSAHGSKKIKNTHTQCYIANTREYKV